MAAHRSPSPEQALAGFSPGLPFAVAFSGGADSTALLLACARRWPGQVRAVHIHHGLQAAADGFEAHCQALCLALGVPLAVRRVQAGHTPGQSPEDAARQARYAALAQAEMVFEGVPETMAAKQSAMARIGAACRADAIITSTTSSILVTDLVPWVPGPERFLNIHWLNPAYLIPVVELSTHPRLDPAVLARAKALMSAIGKLPVVCGPTPGYIVPRLQALVMNEAARMVQEGAATAEEIDVATRYGMGLRFAALGVIEFIDVGGNDILFHASREMAASIDPHRYATPAIVADKMAQGQLGLKTGAGFYDYDGRDIAAYRRDILSRTLGMLQHAGHWHPPATTTHD
jgi:3-hydroxybutyryl-CoA dehydrogenase